MHDGRREEGTSASRFFSPEFEQVIQHSFGPGAIEIETADFPSPLGKREPMIPPEPDRRPNLSAVPDSSNVTDRRAPVSRWILTLSEPLLSPRARMKVDRDMVRFIERNSHWAANWFAGYLSDIAATLPPSDPWRRLSAFIDLDDLAVEDSAAKAASRLVFFNPDGVAPPTKTGSVRPDGAGFGSHHDAMDLTASELGPVDQDIALTALADGIDPLPAALVGFASANVEQTASVLAQVYDRMWLRTVTGVLDEAVLAADRPDGSDGEDRGARLTAGEAWLDVTSTALRWLIHRRRAYTGLDDPFPVTAGFAWMARADRVINEGRSIASEPSLARTAMIDPDVYEQLRNDLL